MNPNVVDLERNNVGHDAEQTDDRECKPKARATAERDRSESGSAVDGRLHDVVERVGRRPRDGWGDQNNVVIDRRDLSPHDIDQGSGRNPGSHRKGITGKTGYRIWQEKFWLSLFRRIRQG